MKATNDESQLRNFEQFENQRTDCFLCKPAEQLVSHIGTNQYTMAGLGPLTDAYAIVATINHGVDEGEDNPLLSVEFSGYTERIQTLLAEQFGTCVLTEHGKMPVCFPDGAAQSHCYHPHFLLFPGVPNPLEECREFFETSGERFESLFDALQAATRLPLYLLVSSRPGEYFVFETKGLPRQYARGIVAELLGRPNLASWRDHPNGDWALRNAAILKEILKTNPR